MALPLPQVHFMKAFSSLANLQSKANGLENSALFPNRFCHQLVKRLPLSLIPLWGAGSLLCLASLCRLLPALLLLIPSSTRASRARLPNN